MLEEVQAEARAVSWPSEADHDAFVTMSRRARDGIMVNLTGPSHLQLREFQESWRYRADIQSWQFELTEGISVEVAPGKTVYGEVRQIFHVDKTWVTADIKLAISMIGDEIRRWRAGLRDAAAAPARAYDRGRRGLRGRRGARVRYVIAKKRKQVLLPRYTNGSDWGVERKLLAVLDKLHLRAHGGLRLIWWTGHSTWFCRGQSGHTPGELMVQWGPHDYRTLDSEKAGETRLARVLKSEAGRKFIREHFVDDDEVIGAIDPRGTIDVREAK